MKTNHQRDFKAREDRPGKTEQGHKNSFRHEAPLSGEIVNQYIHLHDAYNGQEEKARRGAKRHVNRVVRQKENAATKRLPDENNE